MGSAGAVKGESRAKASKLGRDGFTLSPIPTLSGEPEASITFLQGAPSVLMFATSTSTCEGEQGFKVPCALK